MRVQKTWGKAVFVAILLVSTASSSPIIIHINDVDISPQMPTILDTIDISVIGGASGSGSQVEYSEFSQNGTSLQLDLFVDVGILTVPSTWSHIEQVGPFTAESYSLTVRAFEYQDGTFKDDYTTDFTVVPEPGILTILTFGILLIFHKRRKM